MKLKEISNDTVLIDASFEEKFNLAGVLRQSLVIAHGGIDIGTYAPTFTREGTAGIARSVEDQARDRSGLKLPKREFLQIHDILETLIDLRYDLEKRYGAHPDLRSDIAQIVERIEIN